MSKKFLILTDLDNTLFQSKDADPTGEKPMTTDKDGAHHGFSRKDQIDLFDAMKGLGCVIAVTARSHSQMERVSGWSTGADFDLALTDLGINLLYRKNTAKPKEDQWIPVTAWSDHYKDDLKSHTSKMIKDYQLLKGGFIPDAGLADSVRVDLIALGKMSVPLYFSISLTEGSTVDIDYVLERVAKPLAALSGIYSLNIKDNVICFWPSFVSKGSAVKRLIELINNGDKDADLKKLSRQIGLKNPTVMTVGSSLSDYEFMRHGDILISPKGSPIVNSLDLKKI